MPETTEKQELKEVFHLRLSPAIARALREEAAEQERTTSAVMRLALTRYLRLDQRR